MNTVGVHRITTDLYFDLLTAYGIIFFATICDPIHLNRGQDSIFRSVADVGRLPLLAMLIAIDLVHKYFLRAQDLRLLVLSLLTATSSTTIKI